jgi:hypothetical protein
MSTRDQWIERDPLAGVGIGTVCQYTIASDNGTGGFVPHDEWREAETIVAQIGAELGATNPNGTDFD